MRIHVQQEDARRALDALLRDRGCVTLPVGHTLEVVDREPLTLRFFLRAWQSRHPDAELEDF
jgi:hypothetical protein